MNFYINILSSATKQIHSQYIELDQAVIKS